MWSTKLPQPRLDHRRVGQHPPVDRAVIDLEAAFPEHLLDIPLSKRIAKVPRDCLCNQACLEMPTFEIILRLALQRLGNGIQNNGLAPLLSEPQILCGWSISGKARKSATGPLNSSHGLIPVFELTYCGLVDAARG